METAATASPRCSIQWSLDTPHYPFATTVDLRNMSITYCTEKVYTLQIINQVSIFIAIQTNHGWFCIAKWQKPFMDQNVSLWYALLLVHADAPVALVLYNAGPLNISWAKSNPNVQAILLSYFPAQVWFNLYSHCILACTILLYKLHFIQLTWYGTAVNVGGDVVLVCITLESQH